MNREVFYFGLNGDDDSLNEYPSVAIAAVAAKNKKSWANVAQLTADDELSIKQSKASSASSDIATGADMASRDNISAEAAQTDLKVQVNKSTSTIPKCKFFLRNGCEKGESCPFSHDVSNVSAQSCGICLEIPAVYGITNSCDHIFCYGCIKSWREKGSNQIMETVKSCPICRKSMYLIVPSPVYTNVPSEKAKIMDDYKKKISKIPCKNIGNCKFGSNCMFSHSIENGGVMPNVQSVRIVKNADGKTVTLS